MMMMMMIIIIAALFGIRGIPDNGRKLRKRNTATLQMQG